MPHLINILCCVLTIGFGLFGFLAPRYTAAALDLSTGNSTMGLSEMRASVGGLFVVAATAAMVMNHPVGYAMLGFAYAGAALGRGVSIVIDRPPLARATIFGGIEAALAFWLIWANLARVAS